VTGCLAAMWALYRLGLSLVGCSVGSAQRTANGRTHRVTTSGRETSARVATAQWRTQKIAKGGPFSRPRKVDDLFLENYHLATFYWENDNLTTFFFFFAHRLIPMPPPSSLRLLKFSKGGVHLPVHLFSCLLQAVKNNIPSAKGGGHGPLAPPLGTPLLQRLCHYNIKSCL
jgi:hypothetical protein